MVQDKRAFIKGLAVGALPPYAMLFLSPFFIFSPFFWFTYGGGILYGLVAAVVALGFIGLKGRKAPS